MRTRALKAFRRGRIGSGGGSSAPVPPDTEAPNPGTLVTAGLSGEVLVASVGNYSDNIGVVSITLQKYDGISSWVTLVVDWDGTSYFDTGLAALTQYQYRAIFYDAAGNSAITPVAFATTYADTTDPVITEFTIPATSDYLTITGIVFTATDSYSGVTGYLITESATPPLLSDPNWSASAPTEFTVSSEGAKTLYAWVKDAAGNITDATTDTCTVAFPVLATYTYSNFEVV